METPKNDIDMCSMTSQCLRGMKDRNRSKATSSRIAYEFRRDSVAAPSIKAGRQVDETCRWRSDFPKGAKAMCLPGECIEL